MTEQNTQTGLPPLTPAFCGRDRELDQLVDLVERERVVHLSGPAGIGKSELAQAASRRLIEAGTFPAGIMRLAFEDAGRPTTLIGDLILYLGLDEARPLEQALAGRRMLIIWDQMDSVVQALPETVHQVLGEGLAKAEGIHHLVLSRVPLVGFPHMTLGPLDDEHAYQAFVGHLPASISLRPEADDPDLVSALRLLEGNPLAIRLASTWTRPPRWMPALRETLEELDTQAHEGIGAGLARALDAAVDDLDTEPRRLLGLLHGFSGAAPAASLGATYGKGWTEPMARLELTGLSLRTGDRFQMPPAARTHLLQRLGPSGTETYLDQVAFHYQQMANECRDQLEAGRMRDALGFLEREWLNLRGAFCRGVRKVERQGIYLEDDCGLVIDYCTTLFHLFKAKNMASEGLHWMDEGVRAAEQTARAHDTELLRDYRGLFRFTLRDREGARADFETALSRFRELEDARNISATAYHLGLLHLDAQELDAARERFEESLPTLRSETNRVFAAQAHTHLGEIHLRQEAYERAYEELNEALELYREKATAPELVQRALTFHALACLNTGRADDSLLSAQRALAVASAMHPRAATRAIPDILSLSRAYLASGDATAMPRYTAIVRDLTHRLKQTKPNTKVARDWSMMCELFERVSNLVGLVSVVHAGAGNDEAVRDARERLPGMARELDGLTGGLMHVGAWVDERLAGR